jgi:hypothetical protein
MTFAWNNKGSDERYLQPDLLAVVTSILPKVDDPTEFLKEFNKLVGLNREVQQFKAETEAEAEACKRLIAIILEHAKKQGLSPNDLPNLKRKSYDQLGAYIEKYWPELISCI